MGPVWASETVYSSLNLMNRGRPCHLNSLLGTVPHFIAHKHLNFSINSRNMKEKKKKQREIIKNI